jgi:hypothetical protein
MMDYFIPYPYPSFLTLKRQTRRLQRIVSSSPMIIQMVKNNQFKGIGKKVLMPTYKILKSKHEEITANWYKWLMFPFSLDGKAKDWYKITARETKGNWEVMIKNFYQYYLPLFHQKILRPTTENSEIENGDH